MPLSAQKGLHSASIDSLAQQSIRRKSVLEQSLKYSLYYIGDLAPGRADSGPKFLRANQEISNTVLEMISVSFGFISSIDLAER